MGWGNIIGGAIGSFFGPVGTAAGSAIGGAIEGAVTDDDQPQATQAPAAQNFDPTGGALANFRTTDGSQSNGGCRCASSVNPSQVNGLPEEMRGFISAIGNLLNQLGQMLQKLFQGQSDQGCANSPTGSFPAVSPPVQEDYARTVYDPTNRDQTNGLSDLNGMVSFVSELFSMEAQISFNRSGSQGIAA